MLHINNYELRFLTKGTIIGLSSQTNTVQLFKLKLTFFFAC